MSPGLFEQTSTKTLYYLTSRLFEDIEESKTPHGDIGLQSPKTVVFETEMSINYKNLSLLADSALWSKRSMETFDTSQQDSLRECAMTLN